MKPSPGRPRDIQPQNLLSGLFFLPDFLAALGCTVASTSGLLFQICLIPGSVRVWPWRQQLCFFFGACSDKLFLNLIGVPGLAAGDCQSLATKHGLDGPLPPKH